MTTSNKKKMASNFIKCPIDGPQQTAADALYKLVRENLVQRTHGTFKKIHSYFTSRVSN